MRTSSYPTFVLGLTLLGLAASAPPLATAADLPLVTVTNTIWKYYQANDTPANASQPGVMWHTNSFTDTSWTPGKGLFGIESDIGNYAPYGINTPLPLTPPGGSSQTITFYFRVSFSFPYSPAGYSLVFTNYIDDGAVWYLNGKEINRVRLPTTAITYATLASNPPNEGVPDIFTIPATNLVQGANLLAVEVHQSGTGSSDFVFGMSLTAQAPTPIVITSQPQGLTAVAGQDPSVTFSVAHSGTLPRYQWWYFTPGNTNPVAISAGTNASYTLPNPSITMDGNTFFVVITNSISSVRSSNAVLRVVPDKFAPWMLSAIVDGAPTNRIKVNFNESVSSSTNATYWPTSAKNTNNYTLNLVGRTTPFAVTNIQWNGASVFLMMNTNLYLTNEYVLTIRNLADARYNPQPFNQIGVQFSMVTNLVPWYQTWSWLPMFDTNPPSTWTSLNYSETSDPNLYWGHTPGPCWFDLDYNTSSCIPWQPESEISAGYSCYYARAKFVVASNLNTSATLNITHLFDDGAIIYLNGTEILRYNMRPGPANYNTWTISGLDAVCVSNAPITVTNLILGTNILAMEVHQAGYNLLGDDVVFGLNIDGTFLTAPTVIPEITFKRVRNTNVSPARTELRLSWPGTGFALQGNTNLLNTNGWTMVQPVGNNYTNTAPTSGIRYYRLKK